MKTLFRGLLHINAAKKDAIVHLIRWWQLFPNIFPCSYPSFAPLKSIIVAGTSWKLTQVKQKLNWLTFIRFEEDKYLGLVSLNISLHGYSLWGISKRLLLLGHILINKWGLKPNIIIQTFTPHINHSTVHNLNTNYCLKYLSSTQ